MSKTPKHKKDKGLLSRLATTVKADAQTLILGKQPGRSPQAALQPGRPKSQGRISRISQKLNPFPAPGPFLGGPGGNAKAAKKLQKLAKQMAKGKPTMKIRRSRLPIVIALVAMLLLGGGYMLYRSISLPRVHVGRVAKTWLDTTSGARTAHSKKKHHKSRHRLAKHRHHKKSRLAKHHKKHSKARLAKNKRHRHVSSASYGQAE